MADPDTEIVRLAPGETTTVWTTGEITTGAVVQKIHSEVKVTLLEIEEGRVQLGVSQLMTLRPFEEDVVND